MLVLSRKRGATIQIGDDIMIVIGDTTHNRAKVASEASTGVKIQRTWIEQRDEGQAGKTRRVARELQGKGCQ